MAVRNCLAVSETRISFSGSAADLDCCAVRTPPPILVHSE